MTPLLLLCYMLAFSVGLVCIGLALLFVVGIMLWLRGKALEQAR